MAVQFHNGAFRAPADGSGKVQTRGGFPAAGKNEGVQRAGFLPGAVDPRFEAGDVAIVQSNSADLTTGRGQAGSDREKIGLQPLKHSDDLSVVTRGRREPDAGVGLVDITQRLETRVAL